LGKICRSFGLTSWTYFTTPYGVTRSRNGQVILQQDQGRYICNPNVNTPNFDPNDIQEFALVLDPNDRSGNPVLWNLDRVCKTVIIHVFGGDENCVI